MGHQGCTKIILSPTQLKREKVITSVLASGTNQDESEKEQYMISFSSIPATGGASFSLVECNMIVPESTVMNPHTSDAMLLAFCPDQSYIATKDSVFNASNRIKKMAYFTVYYLEHYCTGKNCQGCEHYIIYRRNNCSVERVQCLGIANRQT